MPSFGDVFTIGGDASGYIEAIARANAALNASRSSVNAFAAESIAGNDANIGSLKALAGANEQLKGKIGDLNAAHKEWVAAARKGTDDVAAKEQAYKAALGEVQQATTANAQISVAAKGQLAAATQQQIAAEGQLGNAIDHTNTIEANAGIVVKAGMAEKLQKYAELTHAEEQIRGQMNLTFRDMMNGVPKANQAYAVLDAKLKDVATSKARLGQEVGATGAKMMNLNFVLGQLSYGAQDFVQVLTQPGMGMSDALRSTGNNAGVVAQVMGGPLIGALVTGGIMAAAFTSRMIEQGDSSSKAAKANAEHAAELLNTIPTIKDYNEHLERMRKLTDQSKDSIEGLIDVEGALADMKIVEMLKPLNEAASGKEYEIQKLKSQIKALETSGAEKFMNREDRDRFKRDPNSFFGSYRAKLAEKEKELATIDVKRNQIKGERETDIAKQTIDRQFRRVDEPLKATARIEAGKADAFGEVDDKSAVDRIVAQSGISPKNDAERSMLRGRAQSLLDISKEQIAGESERERLMSSDDRKKKNAGFISGLVNERKLELDRPISDMQGTIKGRNDELRRLKDSNLSDGNVTGKEKEAERALERAIHQLTEAIHKAEQNKEKELRTLEDNLKATVENTMATREAVPLAVGAGLRMVLSPFAGGL